MSSDAAAKARYSRQTAAYGERCGTRIFTSLCVVAFHADTSTGLAAETLKNLALSGVREICLVDDGTPFDAAAHVSSNSLVHPFILQQEQQQSPSSGAAAPTMTQALVAGLRELNDGMAVSTVSPSNDGDASSGDAVPQSWFQRVDSAVRSRFEQSSASNALFILLHPDDRRESAELAALLEKLEQRGTPYMHVQTAGVFGRLTNWFGRGFRVLDATPAQTVQATVASIGFVEGGISTANNNNDDDSSSSNGASNEYRGAYLTLIDDDISADSLNGNPISVDDHIRLIYTGSKKGSGGAQHLLVHQLGDFDSRRPLDGFSITAIENVKNRITGNISKRYFFTLRTVGEDGRAAAAAPPAEALHAFRQWVHAAAAAQLPLRFSQQPPVQVIDNFDTAAAHTGDLGSDTALILRALCLSNAYTKPVQSAQAADDAQKALAEIGSRKSDTNNDNNNNSDATPMLLSSVTAQLQLRVRQAARTCRLQPNFWATFLGAVAAQEALKFFTQRWVPASMPVCFDMADLLPKKQQGTDDATAAAVSATDFFPADAVSAALPENAANRPDLHYAALFGAARLEQLRGGRVFLVGAGALGCEYLKTFALMGIGCSGKGVVTVTDDDSIATSNLSRQLLFRAQHVGHNKSQVAVNAAKVIARLALRHRGGQLNARALQKRLDDKTSHPVTGVFNHRFWSQQTVLVSGVDNVKARAYLSEMSQQHLVPLVDGGTNGPLGHVATILPFVVEPLQPPPPDTQRIAVCTLHFFPTTVAHCSHHALHTFRMLFGEKEPQSGSSKQQQQDGAAAAAVSSSSSSSSVPPPPPPPLSLSLLDDALREACKLYFPLFVQPVLDLRNSKPPDALEADGRTPYYSPQSSRRCPAVPDFDPVDDEVHRTFLTSCAKLLLRSIGHEDLSQLPALVAAGTAVLPASPPATNDVDAAVTARCVALAIAHYWRATMAQLVASYKPRIIQIPNDHGGPAAAAGAANNNATDGAAAAAASSAAAAAAAKKAEEEQANAAAAAEESVFSKQRIVEMEFEKDDEDHLSFVWAATVVRTRAYAIFSPEKSDVQRVAGRMIPALITTTAVVVAAGLFNVCALLLFHNPARPFKFAKAGTAAAVFPIVAAEDLHAASVHVWDSMINLSDGNNAVFSFQHVLDTSAPLNICDEASDKWLRALVRVGDGDSFTLESLICEILKQYLAPPPPPPPPPAASPSSVVYGSVGKDKFESRHRKFLAAASPGLVAAAAGAVSGSFDAAAVKRELESCNVILKLRIGTKTETLFQQFAAAASSSSAGSGGAMELKVKDFPAKMFLQSSLGAGETPPFVEAELLIHCPKAAPQNFGAGAAAAAASSSQDAAPSGAGPTLDQGLTLLARLML